jgi:hypothetical protein
MRYNTVHDISSGQYNWAYGIDSDGYNNGAMDGAMIYGNTVYNVRGANSVGIMNDCDTNALTYKNLVYNIDGTGIQILTSGGSLGKPANSSIHYNIIYNVTNGIVMWDGSGWSILNNTFGSPNAGSYPKAFFVASTSTYVSNITFTNNIIAGGWAYPISVPDSKAIWTQLDYNNIVPNGTIVLYQVSGGAKTLVQLQALGYMTHGITSDPVFVNSTTYDFRLQSNSPCINVGRNMGLTRDFNGAGVPQGGTPEIGAHEYMGAITPSPTPPANLKTIN